MALFTKNDLIKNSYQQVKKSFSLNESVEANQILKKASANFSDSKSYDVFLSHSYVDAQEILGLKIYLENVGYSVYVDWIEDRQLDRSKVSKETAQLLKSRMKSCKSLFFATSENSENSKWMPWELGYFDGIKGKVAILPILNTSYSDSYNGQEYLGLYPYVAKGTIRNTTKEELWIHTASNEYVRLSAWLNGSPITVHK